MASTTRAGSDPGPWDVFKVFELINLDADPERITCVYEWDGPEGNLIRCDKDIDEDRQVRAWKDLLNLPWGSEDSSLWRASLNGAATLLSCGRHDKVRDVQTVIMGWASQAKLHANKARGDRLLLGHGEPANGKVIHGIRAPRPRCATTASKPRVLNGLRRTSSGYNTPLRDLQMTPHAGDSEKSLRKDSALDSFMSRAEKAPENFDTRGKTTRGEPEVFQLDEDVQAVHDALWMDPRKVRSASPAGPKRLRSRSEPEVHMDETHLISSNARAKSATIVFQSSGREQSTRGSILASNAATKSPREEIFDAERVEVGAPELEISIQREQELNSDRRSLNDVRQPKWDVDTKLRQETYAADAEAHLSSDEVERQRLRDQARLEDEIRSHVEQDRNQSGSFVSLPALAEFEVIQSSWKVYMQGWMGLLSLDDDCAGADLFAALPRPVLGGELRAKYATELSSDFEYDVTNFYRNMPGGETFERSEIRKQLKLEIARIHPDKVHQRFPLAGADNRVLELTTRVTQVLTILIALV
ncbi:hypothetical protein CKM354_000825700 [Cercospora kikuchii]|uniref:J domain-containing protein n=1 Tax=Cercospora kikuchii TaxID=84275 RepID=A0A9P3CVH9_9PEZI|nr:uncharacterized protein CKM354_000825700 [Cercospora kikuchii]GIZ45073.1 hypothetical protein CKM354_000825700 [Cercospora kikuchii]